MAECIAHKAWLIAHKAEWIAHKAEWNAHKQKNVSTGESPRVLGRGESGSTLPSRTLCVNQPPNSPGEPPSQNLNVFWNFNIHFVGQPAVIDWICRNSGKIENSEDCGDKWYILVKQHRTSTKIWRIHQLLQNYPRYLNDSYQIDVFFVRILRFIPHLDVLLDYIFPLFSIFLPSFSAYRTPDSSIFCELSVRCSNHWRAYLHFLDDSVRPVGFFVFECLSKYVCFFVVDGARKSPFGGLVHRRVLLSVVCLFLLNIWVLKWLIYENSLTRVARAERQCKICEMWEVYNIFGLFFKVGQADRQIETVVSWRWAMTLFFNIFCLFSLCPSFCYRMIKSALQEGWDVVETCEVWGVSTIFDYFRFRFRSTRVPCNGSWYIGCSSKDCASV